MRGPGAILATGIVLVLAGHGFFAVYTSHLWFAALGYPERYWTLLRWQLGVPAVAWLVAATVLLINARAACRRRGWLLPTGVAMALGLLPAMWAFPLWRRALLWFHQAPTEFSDPVFGHSLGYYLFSLPFYLGVWSWLLSLLVLGAVIAGAMHLVDRLRRLEREEIAPRQAPSLKPGTAAHALLLLAAFFLLLAVHAYLQIPAMLWEQQGVVIGAGYADMHYRRLAYWLAVGVYGVTALVLLLTAWRPKWRRKLLMLERTNRGRLRPTPRTALLPLAALLLPLLLIRTLPAAVQTFVVEPNEITLESPFLRHNIDFTQQAFAIGPDNVDEARYDVAGRVTREIVSDHRAVLDNVRLWDWRALMDNLKEQQEIRLYYEFHDVDIDRYRFDGDYTEVMLAVREMEVSALAEPSQTWVSRHLKYTHGYGLVLLPAHEFRPQGKPDLLLRNIPPESDRDRLAVSRPEIYFGERTDQHVYVNTREKEFDYPAGDRNAYTSYPGKGGVPLDSLLKKIAFAWRFDGYRLLFSGYVDRDSRLLMHRRLTDRLRRLAPFLEPDQDPYPVLTRDGRIQYIVDTYLTSSNYPYAERYAGAERRFHGRNYIRNSVKAVIDATDGTVDLYVVDDTDILVRTWQRILPDLFKPFAAMPDGLRRHVRYPADMLTVQAEVYGTYHMDDVEAFYQREDVWQFATERYRRNFQPITPYYVMVRLPDREEIEFVLMLPFTPQNKNVINAWMAGRCDLPNYGQLTVFTFPKGTEVLGPRQIEARIDQDTEMSRAMTLWGQRGSRVIRGNLLAIPLFRNHTLHLLYAEPIYLQASDARLPEIKRVALADQDRVVWGETFEIALDRLLGEAPEPASAATVPVVPTELKEARAKLRAYREHTAAGRYIEAAHALADLHRLLEGDDRGE